MMKEYLKLTILFLMTAVAWATMSGKEPFVVVIDAGHGGHDAGAVDNGVKEKDINLGVALRLGEMLGKDLKDEVKVVLTRDDDTFISLQKRADIANRSKGNLFISIHTNSVDKSNPNRKSVNGTSVYALGLHKDKDNMRVARRENSVIELEKDYKQKYSGFDPSKDESYIIFEMAQKKNLEQSLKFAYEAQKQLVAEAGRSNRGVKQAGFWVLWATSMPSVLVELDFICNPTTAKFMGSKNGQTKLAEALCQSVKHYIRTSSPADGGKNEPRNSKVKELKVVTDEKKAEAPSRNMTKQSNSSKRRRRSIFGKDRSAAVETADIPLSGSDEAEVEEVSGFMVVDEGSLTVSDENDLKDNKKKKNKKEKKSKKRDKKETKDNSKNYNSRRILVDGSGNVIGMQDIDENGKVKKSSKKRSHKTKKEKIRTVYKIQILASAERLKQNNPRFCGLKPISSFKENDLYKYTVGESSDKEEIESLLEEVKKKIPDAFIIMSSK